MDSRQRVNTRIQSRLKLFSLVRSSFYARWHSEQAVVSQVSTAPPPRHPPVLARLDFYCAQGSASDCFDARRFLIVFFSTCSRSTAVACFIPGKTPRHCSRVQLGSPARSSSTAPSGAALQHNSPGAPSLTRHLRCIS